MRPEGTLDVQTRIRDYYIFRVIMAFQMWGPFWVLWLFANLVTPDGRPDTFRATVVDVAFWTVSFLVAVPAGLLADRYGRRPALMVGSCFWSLGVVLFGVAQTFPAFMLANALWAVGAAFVWGVESAYIYDTLLEFGRAEDYPKVAARGTLLSFISQAVANLVGGAIAFLTGSLQLLLLLTGLSWFGLFAMVLRFREPRVNRLVQPRFLAQLRHGVSTVRRSRALRLIITFQVLVGFVTYLVAFFRQDFIGGLLEGNWLFHGMVFAGFAVVAALAGMQAQTVLHRLGEFGSLALITILVFPSVATMYIVGLPFIPSGFGLAIGIGTQATFAVIWALEMPIISTLVNRRVDSGERALIFGISGFIQTLVLAIFEPLAGLLTLHYEIGPGLFILAMVILAPTLYAVMAFRKASRAPPAPVPIPTGGSPGPAFK